MDQDVTGALRGLRLGDSQRPVYYNYLPGRVNKVSIKELILTDQLDVIVVGEGDFTFSLALAAMRGSWNGITSTCYEDKPFNFAEVKLNTIDWCIKNGREFNLDAERILCNVSAVHKVQKCPDTCVKTNVNCKLFDFSTHCNWRSTDDKRNIVWFQCPWDKKPDLLIRDFMKHMVCQQSKDDYVVIGIAECQHYTERYDLPKLFEVYSEEYEFCGADKDFIKDVLAHGYHHKSCTFHHRVFNEDIHRFIFRYHTTLVFRKL